MEGKHHQAAAAAAAQVFKSKNQTTETEGDFAVAVADAQVFESKNQATETEGDFGAYKDTCAHSDRTVLLLSLTNNSIYIWYHWPFVSPYIAYAFVAFELCFLVGAFIMVKHAPKHEKGKILGQLALLLTFFGAVAVVSILDLRSNVGKVFSGTAAALISIILYGSSLIDIVMVVKTKSVEFVPPFIPSLVTFISGTGWFIVALLESNLFWAILNAFAAGLGAFQLLLHVIYRLCIVTRALVEQMDRWKW